MENIWNEEVETRTPAVYTDQEESLLNQQLEYVYQNSGFYREKFDEAGISPDEVQGFEDLGSVPFTTKDELRNEQAENPPFGRYQCADRSEIIRVHATSGTTGRPLFIALTKNDAELWREVGARQAWAMGIRPEDMILYCTSYSMFVGGVTDHLSAEATGAAVIPVGIGKGTTDRLIELATFLEPNSLGTIPSYVLYLTEELENRGIDPAETSIEKIGVGGEPGGSIPETRQYMEDKWDAEVRDGFYGMADVLASFAGECRERNGLHFCGQNALIPEVIDPETEERLPLEDGTKGELVLTTLQREATPVIRYRTKDMVELTMSPCECGRTSFQINLQGRADNMLIVKGVNVFPTAVEDVIRDFMPRTTGEFLIEAESHTPDLLNIKVEKGENPEGLEEEIAEAINDKLRVEAKIELVDEGEIPSSPLKAERVRIESD